MSENAECAKCPYRATVGTVKAGYGRVVNLGKYESARFYLEVEVPGHKFPSFTAGTYVQGLIDAWIWAYTSAREASDKALADAKVIEDKPTQAQRTSEPAKSKPSAEGK